MKHIKSILDFIGNIPCNASVEVFEEDMLAFKGKGYDIPIKYQMPIIKSYNVTCNGDITFRFWI